MSDSHSSELSQSKEEGGSDVAPGSNEEGSSDTKEMGRSEIVRAVMYGGALAAGLTLVLSGRASAVEASGYVSPFLVVFEGRRGG